MVLREVCPTRVAAWKGQSMLYTDYAPCIKQIAEAENAQEEAMLQQARSGRTGRRTRNSALSSYYRTLNLSELARESLSRICFVDDG